MIILKHSFTMLIIRWYRYKSILHFDIVSRAIIQFIYVHLIFALILCVIYLSFVPPKSHCNLDHSLNTMKLPQSNNHLHVNNHLIQFRTFDSFSIKINQIRNDCNLYKIPIKCNCQRLKFCTRF